MTLNNFRAAASVLIAFCLVGTVVTWSAHLSAPGTARSDAILMGTEFTSPLAFTAAWIVFVLLTFTGGITRKLGVALMTLSALIYAFGDTTELFKSNVGVSDGKWTFIIVATGVGMAIALVTLMLGIGYFVGQRRLGRGSPPKMTDLPAG